MNSSGELKQNRPAVTVTHGMASSQFGLDVCLDSARNPEKNQIP